MNGPILIDVYLHQHSLCTLTMIYGNVTRLHAFLFDGTPSITQTVLFNRSSLFPHIISMISGIGPGALDIISFRIIVLVSLRVRGTVHPGYRLRQ